MEKRNVPKLRFKGFEDEWRSLSIGNTLKIKHGKDQKKIISENGIYPILGTGGEIGRTNTPIYSKESVLIGRKGTIDKPFYMNSPFWTVDTLFYSEILDGFYAKLLFYSFQRINWKKYSEASGVPSLSASTIENIKYNIPKLEEQTKIANFLSNVDNIIEEQEGKVKDLEQYKKGMMQKIFKQEVRFKDENGVEYPEWEEKKLGNVANIIGGGTPSTGESEYWDGNIQWFTPTEIKNRKYISKSIRTITNDGLKNSSAKLLPKGTILLSTRATLGEMAILENEATTNQGFQSLNIKEGFNNEFIYYLKDKIKKYCYKNSSGSTFLEISKSSLEKFKTKYPCLQEQTKIANFLCNIDNIIEEENKKLEDLKLWKKGLLQQMFV